MNTFIYTFSFREQTMCFLLHSHLLKHVAKLHKLLYLYPYIYIKSIRHWLIWSVYTNHKGDDYYFTHIFTAFSIKSNGIILAIRANEKIFLTFDLCIKSIIDRLLLVLSFLSLGNRCFISHVSRRTLRSKMKGNITLPDSNRELL